MASTIDWRSVPSSSIVSQSPSATSAALLASARVDDQDMHIPGVVRQKVAQLVGIQFIDVGIGDNNRVVGSRTLAQKRSQPGAVTAADLDIVAALG